MERCGQVRRGPLFEPLPLPRYLYGGGGGGGDGSGPGGGPGVSAAPPGFPGNENSPLTPPLPLPGPARQDRKPGPEPKFGGAWQQKTVHT